MGSLPHKVRVCVIGTGISGLGAAQRLIDAGVQDILLVEAADRIGGRVHTFKHGNGQIELGAHWIHGEENNVVFKWASENGLTSDELSMTQTGKGNTVFVRDDGEIIAKDVIDEFSKVYRELDDSSSDDFVDYQGSIGEYFTEKFKAVNKWGSLGDELLDWEGRFTDCINGSPNWFQMSAKRSLQYKDCPGNPVVNWKQRGYVNLTDHLMDKIPPSRIKLECPVKQIEWGKDVLSSGVGCKITLTSGDLIEADHVIFTPSIGVLKALANEMFVPPLPTKKIQAIEGLDINTVNKIYIKYPHRWWDEDCDGFSFLHNAEVKPDHINEENWEVSLLGIYSAYGHPSMMCGWITGPGALMMEYVPEEEVARRCTAYLRKRLPNKYQIPDPIYCKRSAWGTNPWTRGAYSFHSLKTQDMNVVPADLAEALYHSDTPLICFAGEATHDCYYSTVHGALESGRREADRLIRYFKRSVLRHGELTTKKERQKYTVVIVGAGAAGIGAARQLNAHGINSVVILEASDRVGGRIHTIEGPNKGVLDVGAQWIHGEKGNILHHFSKSRDLLHHHVSVDGKGNFFTEGGHQIDNAIVDEVLEVMDKGDQEVQSLVHRENITTLTSLSVAHVFRQVFFDYLKECTSDDPDTKRLKEALFYWVLRWHKIDNSCDSLDQLSSICWGSYKFCEGEYNMNPKNGFMTIFNALLAETTAVVNFNSEVECIDYSSEVVANGKFFSRRDGETYPVIVRCRNGNEYEAQHVLVTPSIGFLKKNLNIFSPPLPEKLQRSIMSRGFGTLNKIFLEFEDPWWWDGCEGIHLVWTKENCYFGSTTHHVNPTHGMQQQSGDWWVKGISGFDPVFYHKAVLCGWIGGKEAEYMETLSEEEVGKACTRLLRYFLGQQNIPFPKKVYRSQWSSNRLFQGSYSYHSLGCNCWSGKFYQDELNTPVYANDSNMNKIPLLALAGEANSVKFYSTVHGALQNGITQTAHFVSAQRRLDANKKYRSKI